MGVAGYESDTSRTVSLGCVSDKEFKGGFLCSVTRPRVVDMLCQWQPLSGLQTSLLAVSRTPDSIMDETRRRRTCRTTICRIILPVAVANVIIGHSPTVYHMHRILWSNPP